MGEKDKMQTPDAVAAVVLEAVVPVATALCQYGAMSYQPGVAQGETLRATVVVSTALLQALLFHIEGTYRDGNERMIPGWLRKRVVSAITRSGVSRLGSSFSQIWEKSEVDLHSPEAIERISRDGKGDSVSLRASETVECVNWALKTLNDGYENPLMMKNRALFLEIVQVFDIFSIRNESAVDLGSIAARLSPEIDFNAILPAKESYDAFISYRRSDGLLAARLLKQELEARNFHCFLDVDMVAAGRYDEKILACMKASNKLIFLMTDEAVANLDDPDNPVRLELEAARRFGLGIFVVAAPRTSRSLDGRDLPPSLAFLTELQKYRLEADELFKASVDGIVKAVLPAKRSVIARCWKRIVSKTKGESHVKGT